MGSIRELAYHNTVLVRDVVTQLLLHLLGLLRDQLLEEMMREPLGPGLLVLLLGVDRLRQLLEIGHGPLIDEGVHQLILLVVSLPDQMMDGRPLIPLLVPFLGVDRLRHGEVCRADLLVLDGALLLLHLPTLGVGGAGLDQQMNSDGGPPKTYLGVLCLALFKVFRLALLAVGRLALGGVVGVADLEEMMRLNMRKPSR